MCGIRSRTVQCAERFCCAQPLKPLPREANADYEAFSLHYSFKNTLGDLYKSGGLAFLARLSAYLWSSEQSQHGSAIDESATL